LSNWKKISCHSEHYSRDSIGQRKKHQHSRGRLCHITLGFSGNLLDFTSVWLARHNAVAKRKLCSTAALGCVHPSKLFFIGAERSATAVIPTGAKRTAVIPTGAKRSGGIPLSEIGQFPQSHLR
jgi:hypothetical protein